MHTIKIEEAVRMIPDGSSVMIGGFLGVGSPESVIDELVRQRKKGLTVIANDTATPCARWWSATSASIPKRRSR